MNRRTETAMSRRAAEMTRRWSLLAGAAMRPSGALFLSLFLLLACGSSNKTKVAATTDPTTAPDPTITPDPTPTEKGTSLGAKLTKTLGASGGSIASADGRLTLTFPAGALTKDTKIGIEPITNAAPLGVGAAYRLTPDGAKFPQPITVTFSYMPDDLKGSDESALFTGYQSSDGLWHMLGSPTVDTTLQTVSSLQGHFTDVSLLLGWVVSPAEAAVAPLDSVKLELKYCEPEKFADADGSDELLGLVNRCDLEDVDLSRLVDVSAWSVNGVKHGSVGTGFVDADETGRFATYQAPGVAPVENPVAVGCEFTHGKSKTIAISNVLVTEGGWSGTLSWTLMGKLTTTSTMDTNTYTESGSGMMKVTPGPAGEATLGSVMSTYHFDWVQLFQSSTTDGACMRSLKETRTTTLDGTSTDLTTSTVSIYDVGDGTVSISALMPGGTTMGHVVIDGSETDSGMGANCTSGTSHTDTPMTEQMPSDSFTLKGTLGSDGVVKGNTTVHFDGIPPRDYIVSWNLSSR